GEPETVGLDDAESGQDPCVVGLVVEHAGASEREQDLHRRGSRGGAGFEPAERGLDQLRVGPAAGGGEEGGGDLGGVLTPERGGNGGGGAGGGELVEQEGGAGPRDGIRMVEQADRRFADDGIEGPCAGGEFAGDDL